VANARCRLDSDATKPERISYDRYRAQRHRGAGNNRTEQNAGPRVKHASGDWNAERVRAELMERDVAYEINGRRTPRDDMAGGLESYHVPDAMGWDLQISDRTSP